AATALLSRAYLYLGNWTDAETQSTNIIQNSSLFSLPTDLNSVFLSNSPEAIWQLQQSNADFSFNATPEGNQLIPFDATTQPYAYLTNQQLDAFETGDLRKKEWVDSTSFDGATYYYPYKYKVGPADEQPNGPYTEYYMVFRLAEQYLIRAEARAQLGTNLNGAIDDLYAIRGRTGLQPFQASLTQPQILSSVAHERRIELFCEWGHRWLDLKRTGQATTVLSANKGFSISNNALLYPIPFSEITTDPNLTQNAGY
ncbi:MAG: RagB/SusD family nutrient uptake outer membrane protein, partial [Bacteroidota bacterium]